MAYKPTTDPVELEKRRLRRNANARRYRARYPEKIRAANARSYAKDGARRNWARWGVEPTRPMPKFCECCGKREMRDSVLSLDHCHETGKFRGWLCMKCNTALGKLGDNIEGVKKLLNYLQLSESSSS